MTAKEFENILVNSSNDTTFEIYYRNGYVIEGFVKEVKMNYILMSFKKMQSAYCN